MSSEFQRLRNTAMIGTVFVSALGVALWLSPNVISKSIGSWLILGAMGSLVSAQFIVDSAEKINDKNLKLADEKISNFQQELNDERSLFSAKLRENQKQAEFLSQLTDENQKLKINSEALQAGLQIAQTKIKSLTTVNTNEAVEFLNGTFSEFQDGLEGFFRIFARRYQDVKGWDEVVEKYAQEVDFLKNKIDVIAATDNVKDLIGNALALQYEIIQIGSRLKNRAYKSVVVYLEACLLEVVSIESHNEIIGNLKTEYVKNINSIRQEYGQLVNGATEKFSQHLNEMYGQGMSDTEVIEALQAEIYHLKQELAEASKPLRFPTTTEQARVGNCIIDYFYRMSICLDAIDWDLLEIGYKLLFHVGRNGSRFISADLLNNNDAPQKIKELSGAINLPSFTHNVRGGHMVLEIQTRYPEKKKSSLDEISRLWVSAAKFEQTVKAWSRVRITGGSESGKSPTAENLAVCILKNRSGVAKLFNPQFNSLKNYWTIPVTGTSHPDSEKGIADLAKKVDARSTGVEPKESFELYIFDEIDSTMSHTKGKKSIIGGNVNFIIKQVSHQNLGAIFIGQNANVSEYPGMDRSDWNSAVNLHLGANSKDAITNSNQFTSSEQEKLKSIANKLTEFCEAKNEELGLQYNDPGAYRFALVVEPNKKPYFIELPSFGLYADDENHGLMYGTDEKLPETVHSLKPLPAKGLLGTEISPKSGIGGVCCPDCSSFDLRKNGKKLSAQRYVCRSCRRNFSVK
ncbi:MAG: hypothetical protein HWQ41_00585 [Nostoc sp. NOS(2021)]|nr:hypothetical protein [Nostoc sp. NOS(2021)]